MVLRFCNSNDKVITKCGEVTLKNDVNYESSLYSLIIFKLNVDIKDYHFDDAYYSDTFHSNVDLNKNIIKVLSPS